MNINELWVALKTKRGGQEMPVSLEQWRASVGAINAGHSSALAKYYCSRGKSSSRRDQWSLGPDIDSIQSLLLFLLVTIVSGENWLRSGVAEAARKMSSGVRSCKGPRLGWGAYLCLVSVLLYETWLLVSVNHGKLIVCCPPWKALLLPSSQVTIQKCSHRVSLVRHVVVA